jgi:hypothetical protein
VRGHFRCAIDAWPHDGGCLNLHSPTMVLASVCQAVNFLMPPRLSSLATNSIPTLTPHVGIPRQRFPPSYAILFTSGAPSPLRLAAPDVGCKARTA